MIAKIKELLEAAPFRPFVIVTSGGKHYRVASADHASISPRGSQAFVWLDNGGSITLSCLHLTAVEEAAPTGAAS